MPHSDVHWVKPLRYHSGCDIMRRCSGSGACLPNCEPGGIQSPDTPTPPGSLGPTSSEPRARTLLGVHFDGGHITVLT